MKKDITPTAKPLTKSRWRNLRDIYPYLVMVLPAILVVFLFNYLPIYGVLIAFQDFMPGDEILPSNTIWVGFENFTRFFTDPQFWPLMKNTFMLCIIGFVIGFPLPIIIALSINALKGPRTSKLLQTVFTAPHFISLVVLVGMLQLFFGRYGLVNNIVANFGGSGETILEQFRLANQLKYVSVIVSSVPVLCLYPFVQKYFAQGVMIGSLKG